MEVDLTGTNPESFPELATWGWPVAGYLFLGGLVAGLMILAAVLRSRGAVYQDGVKKADLLALPLLVLGLILLWVDLGNRWNAWRFFTTFEVTSAMSWGSWILLLASAVLFVRLVQSWVDSEGWMPRGTRSVFGWVARLGQRLSRPLDALAIVVGTSLGFYTGILLSSISARPLWDSIWLAPLFLVSGLASAGAFLCLVSINETHVRLAPFSMAMCGVEAALLTVYLGALSVAGTAYSDAAGTLLAGSYSWIFWGVVIAIGLAIPLGIEIGERRQAIGSKVAKSAPIMKLGGALGLRAVILFAGLASML